MTTRHDTQNPHPDTLWNWERIRHCFSIANNDAQRPAHTPTSVGRSAGEVGSCCCQGKSYAGCAMTEVGIHPVASIFPVMHPDEYKELVADIQANGLREPIWLHEGQIIDGRNRYRACVELGIEPRFREWDDCGSLVSFVVSLNLKRRHLTSSQKAVVALEIEKLLRKEAEDRQRAAAHATNATLGRKHDETLSQMFEQASEPNEGKSAQQAAIIVGTNRQYVSDAKKLADKAPDLLEDVKQGTLTIPEAKVLAKLPEPERKQAQAKIASGEAKNAKQAARQVNRETKVAQPLPADKYRVILADPPWQYDTYGDPTEHGRSAESHYPTMTIEELRALPVGDLAAEDCVLFLWVTWPVIHKAFDLCKVWGFEYRTAAFVWAKLNPSAVGKFSDPADTANWFMSLGFWSRANTEACLLFTRGKPARVNADVRQLIVAPVQEHSRKPDEQYERIERLVAGPYIELFARRARAGWSVWGNEAP